MNKWILPNTQLSAYNTNGGFNPSTTSSGSSSGPSGSSSGTLGTTRSQPSSPAPSTQSPTVTSRLPAQTTTVTLGSATNGMFGVAIAAVLAWLI